MSALALSLICLSSTFTAFVVQKTIINPIVKNKEVY